MTQASWEQHAAVDGGGGRGSATTSLSGDGGKTDGAIGGDRVQSVEWMARGAHGGEETEDAEGEGGASVEQAEGDGGDDGLV